MNSDTEQPHPNLNKPTDNLESVPSQKAKAWIDPVDRIAQAAQVLKQEEAAYTDSLIRSESPEPELGSSSFSPGLIVFGLICMFLGGFYLERRSADYRSDVYSQASDMEVSISSKEGNETISTGGGAAGGEGVPSEPSVDVEALVTQGKTVYETYCLACHQANGEGLPAAFPALAGSEWVLEEGPGRIIRAVLQGLQGPIEVKGQAFNSVMVAWRSQLSDDDVASVLTYIRKEWGNDAGYVTPDQVASVWSSISDRGEEAWTADELLAVDPTVESAGAGADSGSAAGDDASTAIDPARVAAGEQVYLTMCLACHQQTGQGLAGLFPPLAGSEWVTANQPDRIVRIVLNGLQGEISVQGQTYNNVMTPWKDMLDDQQVADVLTYIRNAWDNAGSGVSASKVKEIRSATADRDTPWTVAELDAIPVD